MGESSDEQPSAQCGCARFGFARSRKMGRQAGHAPRVHNGLSASTGAGAGAGSGEAGDGGGSRGRGAGGGRGRSRAGARVARGAPASAARGDDAGAGAGVARAAVSLGSISLEEAPLGSLGCSGGTSSPGAERSAQPRGAHSPRGAAGNSPERAARSAGSGAPRRAEVPGAPGEHGTWPGSWPGIGRSGERAGKGGRAECTALPASSADAALRALSAGSTGAGALPADWPPDWQRCFEAARAAVLAECVRASVAWLLKRRFEVPCAPEQAADVRAAVERRVAECGPLLRPVAAASERESARWAAALRGLKAATGAPAVAALVAECEALLVAAMAKVVEPGLPALSAHLEALAAQQLAAAAAALRARSPPAGAALDAAVHGRATAVHAAMGAAMDEVQAQLERAVGAECAAALEARLGGDARGAAALVSAAADVRRRALESAWRLSRLIGALRAEVAQAQPPAAPLGAPGGEPPAAPGSEAARGVGASFPRLPVCRLYRPPSLLDGRPGAHAAQLQLALREDPHGWLRALLLGTDDAADALPPQPRGLAPFVLSFVAYELDPHLDGQRTPPPYAERARLPPGQPPLMERLRQAWMGGGGALAAAVAAERESAAAAGSAGRASRRSTPRHASARAALSRAFGRGAGAAEPPAPAPFACDEAAVVGVYIRHAVLKLNALLGFGPHTPGLGRQPVPSGAQRRHLRALGGALLEALQREFGSGGPVRVGGLALSAALLEGLAAEQLATAIEAHADLCAALVAANREGEEGRRAERVRIWGYS